MLTYDEIVKYITEQNLSELITPYQGVNGTGIVYQVEIEDYGKIEPRLATFDNLTELAEFADKLLCADKITTSQRDLVVSEPKFILRGKVLTTPIISAERKRQKTYTAAQNEYYLYKGRRGQALIVKIEKIKKEIQDLEEILKQFNKKGSLLFRSSLIGSKSASLSSSDEINLKELPLDKGSISLVDLAKLKVTYEEVRRQKQLLQDKIKILEEFAQKNFIKKLRTPQKEIDTALKELDNNADLKPKNTYYDVINFEYQIDHMIQEFNHSTASDYAEYFLELLNFLKSYDNMSIDLDISSFIQNKNTVISNSLAKCAAEKKRMDLESSAPSQEEKNTELLLDLKKQYDEHLTEEQKDALLVYNSQFFGLIGEISNVENFETMDNMDILKQIEKSDLYPSALISLCSYSHTLSSNSIPKDIGLYSKFKSILTQLLPGKTASRFVESINSNTGSVSHDDIFTPLMCDLIGRLKETIRTIQDIPQDAIVLPKDITVYRGVDSRDIKNPQKPSKGIFISTSLRPQIAMAFGDKIPSIYKIHLKKGTPVKILPLKVYSGLFEFDRYVEEANPSDPNGTKEILLCTDDMQDFEITESISPITHYQFEKGEFVESKSGFIITGDMEPKVVQQIRQEINEEKNI